MKSLKAYSISDLVNSDKASVQVFARAKLMVNLGYKYNLCTPKFLALKSMVEGLTVAIKSDYHRLDDINIITHELIFDAAVAHKIGSDEPYYFFGIKRASSYGCKKNLFGVMLNKLAKSNAESKRCSDLNHRISSECLFQSAAGWYPVFITLTVSDEYYFEVFEKGSRAFSDYIYNLGRECTAVANNVGTSDVSSYAACLRYVCVVERGSYGTKRLHLHILAFVKKIPGYVKPPRIHTHLEFATGFKTRWQYGHSSLIPVRTTRSDAYARLGYLWPLDKSYGDNGVIIKARKESNISAIASYMAKYVTKQSHKKDEYTWRTRMTQGYGLQTLNAIYDILPNLLLTISPLLMIRYLKYPVKLPSMSLMKAIWKRRSIKDMSRMNSIKALQKTLMADPVNIFEQLLRPQILVPPRTTVIQTTIGMQQLTMMNLATSNSSLMALQKILLAALQPFIFKLLEKNQCLKFMK